MNKGRERKGEKRRKVMKIKSESHFKSIRMQKEKGKIK